MPLRLLYSFSIDAVLANKVQVMKCCVVITGLAIDLRSVLKLEIH